MVNILVSTYNGSNYIRKQLDSIINQTYTDYKVYIRDDGSTDNTREIIEQTIRDYDRQEKFVFIKGENVGFCESFFELLRNSTDGDYWAFCDQDDYWKPEKIQWAITMMEDTEEELPLMYSGNFSFVNQDMEYIKDYNLDLRGYDFRKSITNSICYGFTCVINAKLRELLLESNFQNIQSHDWYAAMVAMAFGKIITDRRIVAFHIVHDNNDSPTDFWKKIKRGLQLFGQESFYTMNCREFYDSYGELLTLQQENLLKKFLNYKYNLPDAIYKTFYPKRWNNSIVVEMLQRCLMLIGKI